MLTSITRTVATLAALGLTATTALAGDQLQDQDQDQDQTIDQTMDQDQDQTMDRIQDRTRDRLSQDEALQAMTQLRQRLRTQDGVANKAMKAADKEMQRWLRKGGDPEQLRNTVRTAWENDCTGECMQDMVRTQTQARAWGMNDAQASDLVCDALRDRIRERDRTGASWTDAQLGDQIRTQSQQQLQLWEQTRDQEHLQERLREQQRQHQRDMEHMQQQQQGGQHAGGQAGI